MTTFVKLLPPCFESNIIIALVFDNVVYLYILFLVFLVILFGFVLPYLK